MVSKLLCDLPLDFLSDVGLEPPGEHKRQAVVKLEQFNAEQIFALYEGSAGPHKSPHSNRRDTDLDCF